MRFFIRWIRLKKDKFSDQRGWVHRGDVWVGGRLAYNTLEAAMWDIAVDFEPRHPGVLFIAGAIDDSTDRI